MKLITLNSTYEFDLKEKKVRRESGLNPPTDRFRPDGEWKPYTSLSIEMGGRVLIQWQAEKHTLLSPAVSLRDETGTYADLSHLWRMVTPVEADDKK